LTADQLAACLRDIELAKRNAAHVGVFLGEVPLQTQLDFANLYGITEKELRELGTAFSIYAGPTFPINENE